ncbi:hypothetical protein [Nesterenkonia pannonica]|uniref:hypothetical protein n=1 Tax=Nesterenkonia pannonica TaxID=1548602 RepID=UPI00216416D9|nr:hypothetical protein [Nesterenkonia pannonica]
MVSQPCYIPVEGKCHGVEHRRLPGAGAAAQQEQTLGAELIEVHGLSSGNGPKAHRVMA